MTIITTLTASLAFSLKVRSGMVGFGARLMEESRFVTTSFGLPFAVHNVMNPIIEDDRDRAKVI